MKLGKQGDGGGRPIIEFTTEQTKQYEQLASVLTKSQIADYFALSETTLREIERRQPEVSDAYKKGRANAIAGVATNLIKQATAGNISASIFFLKTQAGWKEDHVEETESPSFKIEVNAKPPVRDMKITKGKPSGTQP